MLITQVNIHFTLMIIIKQHFICVDDELKAHLADLDYGELLDEFKSSSGTFSYKHPLVLQSICS